MSDDLFSERLKKLQALESAGIPPFAYNFEPSEKVKLLKDKFSNLEDASNSGHKTTLAGRLMALRRHGKASFGDLQDDSGRIQLFLSLDNLKEERYELFLSLDIGDIVGVKGEVFKTRRGELSVKVEDFELLTKSLHPLPEKWHGLTDIEARYRRRYVDLIMNPEAKKIFETRSKAIRSIRSFLEKRDFVEVDTPILQQLPGGATARPFTTFHNALDTDLYLRVAPELFLKRLLVGGYEKVFELGRMFRNEGLSVKHNPEFTMLEAYQAYGDYKTMMELTEELLREVTKEATGSAKVTYQEKEIDFGKTFPQMTMLDSVKKHTGKKLDFSMSLEDFRKTAKELGVEFEKHFGKGKILAEIFEKHVEDKLFQPTFITDFPKEISPLAKESRTDPEVTERFELIVANREIANAFSELTDPIEQRKRFEQQIKMEKEEEISKTIDDDFIKALEYGMPPAGGLGIGIDRFIMLITDAASIRDVLLFPHLRPKE